jgi:hypothetical protein
MKTSSLKYVVAAVAAGALGATHGCAGGDSPSESIDEVTATIQQANLPVRDFVQLPRVCAGAVQDLDPFQSATPGVKHGTLVASFSGPGKYSLSVRENNGSVFSIAGLANYVTKPAALTLANHRVVCTMQAALVDRGPGPQGEVFSFDKSQGTQLVCWHNTIGSSTWTQKVVAKEAALEPKDAFWPMMYGAGLVGGVTIPDAYEVVYLRDAEYAPWIRTSIGRAAREGLFFARVSIGANTMQVFDQDTYPDWRQDALDAIGPVECDGGCGFQTNGFSWTDCGGCGGGDSCHGGECQPGTCTPLSAADACASQAGAQACGERSDGCGGKITCPS